MSGTGLQSFHLCVTMPASEIAGMLQDAWTPICVALTRDGKIDPLPAEAGKTEAGTLDIGSFGPLEANVVPDDANGLCYRLTLELQGGTVKYPQGSGLATYEFATATVTVNVGVAASTDKIGNLQGNESRPVQSAREMIAASGRDGGDFTVLLLKPTLREPGLVGAITPADMPDGAREVVRRAIAGLFLARFDRSMVINAIAYVKAPAPGTAHKRFALSDLHGPVLLRRTGAALSDIAFFCMLGGHSLPDDPAGRLRTGSDLRAASADGDAASSRMVFEKAYVLKFFADVLAESLRSSLRSPSGELRVRVDGSSLTVAAVYNKSEETKLFSMAFAMEWGCTLSLAVAPAQPPRTPQIALSGSTFSKVSFTVKTPRILSGTVDWFRRWDWVRERLPPLDNHISGNATREVSGTIELAPETDGIRFSLKPKSAFTFQNVRTSTASDGISVQILKLMRAAFNGKSLDEQVTDLLSAAEGSVKTAMASLATAEIKNEQYVFTPPGERLFMFRDAAFNPHGDLVLTLTRKVQS